MSRLIADVSRWQDVGTIKRLYENFNISGVMIRAGSGTKEDEKFRGHLKDAQECGIDIGVYWYSYAKSVEEVISEWEACLNVINTSGLTPTLPVVYDLEEEKVSTKTMNEMARAFLIMAEGEGFFAMLYSNLDFYKRVWDPETKELFAIWYARPNKKVSTALSEVKNAHLVQFTFAFNGDNQDMNEDVTAQGLSTIVRKLGAVPETIEAVSDEEFEEIKRGKRFLITANAFKPGDRIRIATFNKNYFATVKWIDKCGSKYIIGW